MLNHLTKAHAKSKPSESELCAVKKLLYIRDRRLLIQNKQGNQETNKNNNQVI